LNDSIGQRLRSARERKGLTLSEVSTKIRVRESILKLIENNDFEKVGADVYVRGHIRSMANFLGLDTNELMSLYPKSVDDNSDPDIPVENIEAQSLESNLTNATSFELSGSLFNPVEKFKTKSGTNWSVVMAGALAVITLISIGSVIVSTINSPSTDVVAEETITTPSPAVTTNKSENENLTAAVPTPGVDVLIQAVGSSSWVRATDLNDVELFEGIIRDGQEQRVGSVEGVKLLLGNAGALNLTVNGQVLGKAGGNGEVVRVEFGPEGPVQ
jgi:cytoskeleton protein RodZ